MTRICLAIFIFILTLSFTFLSFAESSRFISGFEDIPLMRGLKQSETDDFSFGNEETRYIEARLSASSGTSFDDVKKFYKETLKQFGWKKLKDESNRLIFYRENDQLEISRISRLPLKISIILKNRA